jgi:hypothetical protein
MLNLKRKKNFAILATLAGRRIQIEFKVGCPCCEFGIVKDLTQSHHSNFFRSMLGGSSGLDSRARIEKSADAC